MSPAAGLANVTDRIATIESRFSGAPTRSQEQSGSSRTFGDVLDQVGGDDGSGLSALLSGTSASRATSTATATSGGLDEVSALIRRLSTTSTDGSHPAATAGQATGAPATGDDIVQLAMRHLGTPYVWGAESPQDGFDCSGLVQYVYRQAGIEVPRVSRDQARIGAEVANLAAAQPGDLVAFDDPVDHIGIYAGNGRMVVAPRTGDVVKVQDIRETPTAIRRVIGAVAPDGPMTAALSNPAGASGVASMAATPGVAAASGAPPATGQAVLAFLPTMIPLATATSGILTPAPGQGHASPSPSPAAPAAVVPNAQAAAVPLGVADQVGGPVQGGVHREVASAPFGELFAAAGERHGVSPALLEAVAQAESGFDPTAISPVGARGLMQIMPGTARELGVDPMDPAEAVDGAARLLKRHLDRYGSVELALAAYNAGPGAVDRFDGIPPYRETQNYVRKIMADLRTGASIVDITDLAAPAEGAGPLNAHLSMARADPPPTTGLAAPPLHGSIAERVEERSRPPVRVDGAAAAATAATRAFSITAPATSTATVAATSTATVAATATASSATAAAATGTATASTTTPAAGGTAPSLPPQPTGAAPVFTSGGTAPDGSPLVLAGESGPKPGDWGKNTQMQVRASGGYNVRSWRELGFLEAATPADVQAAGASITTPIAKGVLRILRDATPAQLASREFRETVNTINREILEQPTAPEVLPLDATPAPAPTVGTPAVGAPAVGAPAVGAPAPATAAPSPAPSTAAPNTPPPLPAPAPTGAKP